MAAHHGSLSAARRRIVEQRLRAGDLRALVATASLELGIDVGPVELVCQIGSPRAIGTFLQRVGRANHHVEGTPAGRLYPLTRDELVECTALLAGVRAGHLDVLHPPVAPLDVLTQQVVAEVAAAGEWDVDALFDLVRRAAPSPTSTREAFDEVVDLASWGIQTGRGRRGAHLHHDAVNGRLRARRGARLAALTSGGAIPETGDYRVVLDPDGVTVGSVHEDFAVEATAGDIFLLGTHSWRVVKVETGTVRVVDAADLPPTIPFWLGEAPARTAELSAEVGDLRAELEPLLAGGRRHRCPGRPCAAGPGCPRRWPTRWSPTWAPGSWPSGHSPPGERLVVERVFDEAEGTQLIVHSPYGGRINRALGLALRKRFCVSFDFELQAAADDDTVVLSLGPQHSFPLPQVPSMLHSGHGPRRPGPGRAAPPHAGRPLAVEPQPGPGGAPLARGVTRRPIHLQRMEAEDMLAAAWPALAACQENAPPGPVAVPDHVLVRQTVDDCLTEPLDADGLVDLLAEVEAGRVSMHFVESAEPSPLAHGILTGKPYTFLDGAPLEERRTRAVAVPRGLGVLGPDGLPPGLPVPPGELATFDPAAEAEVLDQVRPAPRDADELHDLLLSLVLCREVPDWRPWFAELVADGRAGLVGGHWAPTERRAEAELVLASLTDPLVDADEALAECVGGHLDLAGPVTVERLVDEGHLPSGRVRGVPVTVARARIGPGPPPGRRLGHRAPRRSLVRTPPAGADPRRQPVPPTAPGRGGAAGHLRAVPGLLAAPGRPARGPRGGPACSPSSSSSRGSRRRPASGNATCCRPASPAYDPRWLDELCLAGQVAWGRLTPRPDAAPDGDEPGHRGTATPSPATPLALVCREDLGWTLAAVRAGREVVEPSVGASADLLAVLRSRGASFRSELPGATGRLGTDVDEGLWDLVSRGIVTADAFSAVRSLLAARARRRGPGRAVARRTALGRARTLPGSGIGEGRWSLLPEPALPDPATGPESEELAEAVAWQLLARWGVVAWEVWERESYRIPWRDVVRALRRLEARGQAMGGRFVAGISGEQYAAPDAAELLGQVHRDPHAGRGGHGGRGRSAQPDRWTAGRAPGALGAQPVGALPRRRAHRLDGRLLPDRWPVHPDRFAPYRRPAVHPAIVGGGRRPVPWTVRAADPSVSRPARPGDGRPIPPTNAAPSRWRP